MISKEKFVEIMERLQKQEENIDRVDDAIKVLDPDFGGFGIPSASSITVDLLQEIFEDDAEWLDYFVWEMDWLKEIDDQCIIENGYYIVIKNWADVYDMLTKNYEHLKRKIMEVKEINADIFTASENDEEDDIYYAHCISNDYALGAGIAVAFNNKYDMRRKLHKEYPNEDCSYVGKALLVDNVFNLVTKTRCWHKPTYDTLREALEDLKTQCLLSGVTKLAIPKIGCGLDGLDWECVKEFIEDVFKDIKIDITCYYI